MSEERELLKLCAEAFALHNKCPNLTGDINELLAQPEQFKPDWVSYRQGVEDGINQAKNAQQEHVGIVKTIGGYPDQSEHTVELTGRHGDLRDGDLLYKAPPKREPLMTDSDIRTHTPFHYHDAEKKAFALGVRWAEAHGIGATL